MASNVRERILEAGKRVFARYGFHKTSLADIADEAHMGKSSLYYYFDSKEALFGAVAQADVRQAQLSVHAAVESAQTPGDKLKAYFRTWTRQAQDLATAYELLYSEGIGHLECVEQLRRFVQAQELETLSDILREGIAAGMFRMDTQAVEGTARAVSLALHCMDDGATLARSEHLAQDVERLIDLVVKGLQG